VIDPILQSTYLGGSKDDSAYALAIHPTTGEIYVAGMTKSKDFPQTAGGAQEWCSKWVINLMKSCYDVFVARLNKDLTQILQSTYLGGSDEDYATALAIHPKTGEVYVAGETRSKNFPKTTGGAQAVYGGGYRYYKGDAFVARLNKELTQILQSTYLGGSSRDYAIALAIHPKTGEVYVAGATESKDFPKTTGGAQRKYSGSGEDAFVARLNSDLTQILQSTYLGGSDNDYANAIAIHPKTGEVYVAGATESKDFPKTTGGAQRKYSGSGEDAFVARLNKELTQILQSTYLGGSGIDWAKALAIHPQTGEVYVAGKTGFTTNFVARLNKELTQILQATYPGESGYFSAPALAIHPKTGEVYVAGETWSKDFPKTAGGAQAVYGGGDEDAFVARLNKELTQILQATYLGGSGNDNANALAIHPQTGEIYVAGWTTSDDFPKTACGAQTKCNECITYKYYSGSGDAFVARLSADLSAGNGSGSGGSGGGSGCRYPIFKSSKALLVFVVGRRIRRK
jgi:muconolactone delta-isomerase